MKFKVGDYARILNGAIIEDYAGGWTGAMADHVGEIHKVEYAGEKCSTVEDLPFVFDNRGLALARSRESVIRDEVERGSLDVIRNILVNREKEITTVTFIDGDIKMVKCAEGVPFDEYFAVASALAEHVYGNNTQFKKAIKKHTHYVKPKKPKKPRTGEAYVDAMSVALQPLMHSIDESIKKLEQKIEKARIDDGE